MRYCGVAGNFGSSVQKKLAGNCETWGSIVSAKPVAWFCAQAAKIADASTYLLDGSVWIRQPWRIVPTAPSPHSFRDSGTGSSVGNVGFLRLSYLSSRNKKQVI